MERVATIIKGVTTIMEGVTTSQTISKKSPDRKTPHLNRSVFHRDSRPSPWYMIPLTQNYNIYKNKDNSIKIIDRFTFGLLLSFTKKYLSSNKSLSIYLFYRKLAWLDWSLFSHDWFLSWFYHDYHFYLNLFVQPFYKPCYLLFYPFSWHDFDLWQLLILG